MQRTTIHSFPAYGRKYFYNIAIQMRSTHISGMQASNIITLDIVKFELELYNNISTQVILK
jgi:hypothetical protein